MKLIKKLLVFVFFWSFSFFVGAQERVCGDIPVLKTSTSDGKEITLKITESSISSTHEWKMDQGEPPPLSITEALEVFNEWVQGKNRQYSESKLQVNTISLNRYPCSEIADKWYYVIEYFHLRNGVPEVLPGSWVAITMDGNLVVPTVRP